VLGNTGRVIRATPIVDNMASALDCREDFPKPPWSLWSFNSPLPTPSPSLPPFSPGLYGKLGLHRECEEKHK